MSILKQFYTKKNWNRQLTHNFKRFIYFTHIFIKKIYSNIPKLTHHQSFIFNIFSLNDHDYISLDDPTLWNSHHIIWMNFVLEIPVSIIITISTSLFIYFYSFEHPFNFILNSHYLSLSLLLFLFSILNLFSDF